MKVRMPANLRTRQRTAVRMPRASRSQANQARDKKKADAVAKVMANVPRPLWGFPHAIANPAHRAAVKTRHSVPSSSR